jgi:hypothetical protein
MQRLSSPLALLVFLCLFIISSCDDLGEDMALNLSSDTIGRAYGGPGSTTVISLTDYINSSFPFEIIITQQPQYGKIEIHRSGLLLYTPNPDFISGTDLVGYRIIQEDKIVAENFVEIIIDGGFRSKFCKVLFKSEDFTVKPGSTNNNLDIFSNDVLCDSAQYLTTNIVISVSRGRLSKQENNFTYTPNTNFEGQDDFIYSICIGSECRLVYASITVTNTPTETCIPEAKDDAYQFNSATLKVPLQLAVLKNDSLCGPDPGLELLSVKYGQAIVTDGIIELTPPRGFTGTDSLRYAICSPENFCDEAIVVVEIN